MNISILKKCVYIIFIISGILTLLSFLFKISFTIEVINEIIIIIFAISGIACFYFITMNIWISTITVIILALIIGVLYFSSQLIGYESRIDQEWNKGKYNIQLQSRLYIAGPGSYWFIFNQKLLCGIIQRRINSIEYKAVLPIKPDTLEFIIKKDTLKIEVHEPELIILPDSTINK